MLAHFRRRNAQLGRRKAATLTAALLALGLASSACDKMPLLAPTGTVITLFANSTVMSPNETIEITATLIENGAAPSGGSGSGGSSTATSGAGTPVHNGTLVTFTSTIGSIDPKEARTHNGQVNVRLRGDGRNGVAKVVAFSGGAKSAELEISIGAAAADRVVLTATPQTLSPSGGTAQLAARVEDLSGNPLTDVPVTFSTTTGTIPTPTANTDATGVARASLTTSQKAEVTASVGSKTAKVTVDLAPRSGLAITPPTAAPTAGSPAAFTVAVATTANVRDVTVSWGDGTSTSLGAISGSTIVSHVYGNAGTYTVTATSTNVTGDRESVSTAVTVLPAPPAGVTISYVPPAPTSGQTITFTATVTPSTFVPTSYLWEFNDVNNGTPITPVTTTGNSVQRQLPAGTYTLTVTVTGSGRSASGQIRFTVS